MNLDAEFEVIRPIPEAQILQLENKIVENVAMLTRQETNNKDAFPYLTGELKRSELGDDIINIANLEYGLSAGVDYAKYVWDMPARPDTNWTNDKTEAQWYLTIYKNHTGSILQQASISAIRSVK